MPKDKSKKKNEKSISRRSLLGLGAGAFIYQLLGPNARAYAIDNPWSWAYKWHYCAYNRQFGLDVATDRQDEQIMFNNCASIWTQNLIWDFSKYWSRGGDTATLGAGLKNEVTCEYENALFSYIRFRPLAQAYSCAPYSGHYIGWHNTADDNMYRLVVTGDIKDPGEVAHVSCVFNLDTGGGDGHYNNDNEYGTNNIYFENTKDHIDTAGYQWYTRFSDYADWGAVNTTTQNLRRGNEQRNLYFQSAAEYWNYFCNIPMEEKDELGNDQYCSPNGYGHDTPDKGYLAVWMKYALHQVLPPIAITRGSGYANCGIEWAGRIVAICDGNDTRKSLFVGDGANTAGNCTDLLCWPKADEWPDAGARLNRNWYVNLNTVGTEDAASWNIDNKWKGTLSILNVMQLNHGGPRNIDQNGGELVKCYGGAFPDYKAQIYDTSRRANQAFWIHTDSDKQFIISDASGLMMEHPFPENSDRCSCYWHSNGEGLARDVESGSHQWKLQDVVFQLRSGSCIDIRSSNLAIGSRVDLGNKVEAQTYPCVSSGNTNLRYEYMWVRMSKTQTSAYLRRNNNIRVMGQAYCEHFGETGADKPANNMLGAKGVRALEKLRLKIAGSSIGGSIKYRLHKAYTPETSGWGSWKRNGDTAEPPADGNGTIRSNAIQIELEGDLANYYSLRYSAGNAAGWGDWKASGETAWCPLNTAYPAIDAIAVEIIPLATPGAVGTRVAGEFGWSNSYKCQSDDVDKRIVCVARAVLEDQDYDRPRYLGYVCTSDITVSADTEQKPSYVHYILDNKEIAVETFNYNEYGGDSYDLYSPEHFISLPVGTTAYSWYSDKACTKHLDWSFLPIYENEYEYYVYGYTENKTPVTVHYVLEGKEIKTDQTMLGKEYTVLDGYRPDNPYSISLESGCTLDGWYLNKGYYNMLSSNGTKFTPSTSGQSDYYIYAGITYPKVIITFEFADSTKAFFDEHKPYTDSSLTTAASYAMMKPTSPVKVSHGGSFTPSWSGKTTTAYVARTDGTGSMKVSAKLSVYKDKTAVDGSTAMPATFKPTTNMTLYVVWTRPTYDGFDSN